MCVPFFFLLVLPVVNDYLIRVVGSGGATFWVNHVEPYPAWNEFVTYQYGYALVTAVNATHLDWKWVNSINGQVGDRMVITQVDPHVLWVLPCATGYTGTNCSACAVNYTTTGSSDGSSCIVDNCATLPANCAVGSCTNTGASSYTCGALVDILVVFVYI